MISSAMLNGHSGSMSTGHANNPADMLHRLETMMMMGIDLPLQAIQRQIASALDIISIWDGFGIRAGESLDRGST